MSHPAPRIGAVFAILSAAAVGVFALAEPSLSPPPGPIAESGRFGLGTALSLTNTPGDADSHFKITQPGHYYLTGNVVSSASGSAIEVAADNVVIDLNGFTLTCASDFLGDPVTTSGIVAATTNLVVRNGTVRRFEIFGIATSAAQAVRVENVHAVDNGGMSGMLTIGTGIALGPGSAVVRCTAYDNGNIGISVQEGSSVIESVAYSNGNVGISAADSLVAHCTAFGNTNDNIDIGATASTLVGNHAP